MTDLKLVPSFEVTTDGRTVWVNGDLGCLARFNQDLVEVWGDPPTALSVEPRQRISWKDGYSLWRDFCASVQDAFGIPLTDAYIPLWVLGPKYHSREIQDWPRNIARTKGRERLQALVQRYEEDPDEVPLAPLLAAAGRAYLKQP